MKFSFLLFSFIAIVTMGQTCAWAFDPEIVAEAIRFYRANPAALPSPEQIESHRNTRFILIKGLAGEFIPGYFGATRKMIERLTGTVGEKDPTKKRVDVIKTDSTRGIEESTEYVANQIEEIVKNSSPETNFLELDHSMGALVGWRHLLRNPDFLRDRMLAAIFVQGPFGGSPLASFVSKEHSVSLLQPFWNDPFMYGVKSLLLAPYRHKAIRPGIDALVPLHTVRDVHGIIRASNGSHTPELQEKTVYVTTFREPPTGIRGLVPGTNMIMDICIRGLKILGSQENDGMVPLRRQAPPGVQDRTVVIEGAHHGTFTQTGSGGRAIGKAVFAVPAGGK